MTQLLDPFEGEGADAFNSLANRLRSMPVRTVLGAIGGGTRAGVQYGPQGAIAGAGAGAVEGALSTILSPGLWQRFVPTIKVMTFDELTKAGMADQAAARLTNTLYGGENKVRIAQAAWTSALARTGAFAPDWWASELKTLGSALGSGDPQEVAKARQVVLNRVLFGELLHEGLNWALTGGPNGGHFSWQNAPGHEMDVETKALKPTSDSGQPQTNFIDGRLLFDPRDYDILKLGASIARGQGVDTARRFIGNRLSVPIAQTAEQAANSKYVDLGAYEPPITKPTDSASQQFLSRAAQAAGILAPAGATTPIESYEQTGLPGGALSALTGGRMTSQSDSQISKNQAGTQQNPPPRRSIRPPTPTRLGR